MVIGQSNCVKRFFPYIQMHLGNLPACQVNGGIENVGFYAFGSLDVSVRFISRQCCRVLSSCLSIFLMEIRLVAFCAYYFCLI